MDLPTIKVRVTVDGGAARDVSVVARDGSAALAQVTKLAKQANPKWSCIECEVIEAHYVPQRRIDTNV